MTAGLKRKQEIAHMAGETAQMGLAAIGRGGWTPGGGGSAVVRKAESRWKGSWSFQACPECRTASFQRGGGQRVEMKVTLGGQLPLHVAITPEQSTCQS